MQGNSVTFSSNLSPSSHDRSRGLQSPQVNQGAMGMSGYPWNNNQAAGSSTNNFGTGAALGDSLAQSKSQYQSGYLLSLAQSQSPQSTGQRFEEAHLIPTRAKMNPAFPRSATSDFGTESTFESSKHRHREPMDDEDGPPTTSVFDIVNEVHADSYGHRLKPQAMFSTPSRSAVPRRNEVPSPPPSQNQTLHVIVFGYPPSRFSSTLAHFQSIAEGGTTEPETSLDVENAFKIGYRQPWEAARAWRRNGETINSEGGRWMVGVKWADPQYAEQVLGTGARTHSSFSPYAGPDTQSLPSPDDMDSSPDPAFSQLQRIVPQTSPAPSIGTPIQLAPSTSAFKKPSPEGGRRVDAQSSQAFATSNTPSKGVIGQMSDLIFGW